MKIDLERKMLRALTISGVCGLFVAGTALAHHSVLNYDGKVEITISGVVTAARFGFPHSVYKIDVTADDGSIESWVLSTEDPRDAERLGFRDEIEAIKIGDPITVVGWPDRFKKREIRGHQLHYPDGTVVMMRRGNYIWPKDILRLDRFVMNPGTLQGQVQDIDASLPAVEQVILWIKEGDHVARAAFEVTQERPRLIGVEGASGIEFVGVDALLKCHTQREGFTLILTGEQIGAAARAKLDGGVEYISEYNRVLSRWWEQERQSCD